MNQRPWSHSRKSVADTCALRFFHKYVSDPRTPKQPVSSSAGRIGNAVHILLEHLVQGRDPQRTFIRACSGLTHEEIHEVKAYRDGIFRFLDRFEEWCDKRNIAPDDVYPEMEVAFTEEGDIVDYWDSNAFWRGKLDLGVRVMRDDGPSMVIIDHKTGSRTPEKDKKYNEQLEAYAIGAYYKYPDIVGVQTLIHWVGADLREDMYAFGAYRPRAEIELTLIPKFFSSYATTEARVGTVTDEASAEPTAGHYCRWCEYAYACPLKA